MCSTYRCGGCGAALFSERHGAPMTMFDHAAWREAKQMRPLDYPALDAGFPKATALRDRSSGR
jgi:hypothetical protein